MRITTVEGFNLEHLPDEEIDALGHMFFSHAMLRKLNFAREHKGRHGWYDPKVCSIYDLSIMLTEAIQKGDPVDVANFAMMLHQRDAKIDLAAAQRQNFYFMTPAIALTTAQAIMNFIFPKENRASSAMTPSLWDIVEIGIAEFLAGMQRGEFVRAAVEDEGWSKNDLGTPVWATGDYVDLIVKLNERGQTEVLARCVWLEGKWFRSSPSGTGLQHMPSKCEIMYWRKSK